ncbi:hypothetical protein ACPA0F_03060 [Solibacillus silvestris]
MEQIKLDQILGEFFCQHYKIDNNDNYKIEQIDAKELIVPERIDLIAKIKYIEYREKGSIPNYIKELYTAHIEAFSNGSYTEPGNDSKNTINKYFNVFNNLIDNIKQSGVDNEISVIPVGKNNVILDGAHRVAIAAYFNYKVPIIRFESLYANYGVEFFRNRLLHQKHIDHLIIEYCKLKGNLNFICIWPELQADTQIEEIINRNNECKVLFREKINYEGLQSLITRIDTNLEWKGEYIESEEYFNIYLLECNSFCNVQELKANIRDTLTNPFIYITKNQKETIQLANILLSHSEDTLNRGKPNNYDELQNWFKRKIRNVKHNSRRKLILLAKKIGFYKDLRIFYHYLRDIIK